MLRNFQVLNETDIEQIHEQSLKILAEIGFKIPHNYFISLFKQAGARVNEEEQLVNLPAELIEEAISYAKPRMRTFNQSKKPGQLSITMPSEAFYVDYKTKTKRNGTKEDVIKGITLGNRLPNIDVVMPIVLPNEVPGEIVDIVCHQLCFMYSEKDFHAWTFSPETADYIIEMAAVVAGGEQELRNKKPITYIGEMISPFHISYESLEIALKYSKFNLPIGFGSIVTAGTSGPITLAGTLASQNAEFLMGLVLCYLLKVEELVAFAAGAHTMDLRTMGCSFGNPNQSLLAIAQVQMSKRYGLPATWNVGLSDANYPDFQCGFEKGMSAALALAAGINDIGLQGIVGADQGASFEQLVIDNEWVDAINHVFKGFTVSEETLAWEATKSVGIGGIFITEEHTLEHMRDGLWDSKVFNRDTWENWQRKGGGDTLSSASAKVEQILGDNFPPKPVISESVKQQLEEIVQKATLNLCKKGAGKNV